jgi:fructose-1,6-bisphosphatase/inositol monophosphatase family enzyme
MQVNSISALVKPVQVAGAMALDEQRKVAIVERSYKQDGSVLTRVDKMIEDYLVARISELYPEANVVAEETSRPFDPAKANTFAIDPIDGTDVYSLGMPGWCVSIGLLDGDLQPVAGILFAPRLNLLLVADVGAKATCDGCELLGPRPVNLRSSASSLMVSSRIHRWLDLGGYPGKARSIGSAALHLVFPLVYPTVDAGLQHRGVHVWDLAGTHALLRAQGFTLTYLGGDPVDYAALVDGSTTEDEVISGSSTAAEDLRRIVARR